MKMTATQNVLRCVLALSFWSVSSFVHAQAAPDVPTHPFGVSRPISGQYIVVFRQDVAQPAALAAQMVGQAGGRLLHTYTAAIKGFSARLPDAAVSALAKNPNVERIEQDQSLTLNEALISPPSTQASATWGLDRIDQRDLPINGSYRYEYTGSGVFAFIIDTGILATHADFGGRVSAGYTSISDGQGTNDCNGHGTHVAGTVGGSTWGVAKGVSLVPVRVLDCSGSGTNSGVIAGIDFVANASTMRPAVANMSLGGAYSSALNSAVAGAVSKGVTMVVAAGNSNADACNYSPSSEPSAITVGATTNADARASYSNYGKCLDIFAPGTSITSAWITSTTATNTISGTSMATPHVTGVAALLSAGGVNSPASITSTLLNNSTTGKVTTAGTGSPNRLVFSVASQATSTLQTVAVSAISGAGKKSASAWKATATVTLKTYDGSNFGTAVAGATITGGFSPGGNTSCVTGTNGACTLASANISQSYTSSTFTVTGASGTGLSYDPSKNALTVITVARP